MGGRGRAGTKDRRPPRARAIAMTQQSLRPVAQGGNTHRGPDHIRGSRGQIPLLPSRPGPSG